MEALMLVQQPIPPQLSPSPECSCWALPKTPQKCKVDQHCRFLASSLGSLNWKRDSSWILRYIGVRLSAGWVFFPPKLLCCIHDWFCYDWKFIWWIFGESCCKAMRDWAFFFFNIYIPVQFLIYGWVVLKNIFFFGFLFNLYVCQFVWNGFYWALFTHLSLFFL